MIHDALDVLTDKKVKIPEDTEIKTGNSFILNGIRYIIITTKITKARKIDIEVMPAEELYKRHIVQMCEDGEHRTLKEIEDMSKNKETLEQIQSDIEKACSGFVFKENNPDNKDKFNKTVIRYLSILNMAEHIKVETDLKHNIIDIKLIPLDTTGEKFVKDLREGE